MTDRQTFYKLYAQVCESIPVDYAEKVLKKNPMLKITRLQNVRYGRTPDLYYLDQIIKACRIVNKKQVELNKAA